MTNTTEIDKILNLIEPHEHIETTLNMSIAVRVADLMKSRKKSKEDLAEHLNVETTFINQMLAGVIDFDIKLIARLTAYFGKSVIIVKMSKLEKEKKENAVAYFKIKFQDCQYDFYLCLVGDFFGKARTFIDELKVYFEPFNWDYEVLVSGFYLCTDGVFENSDIKNRHKIYFGDKNDFCLYFNATTNEEAIEITKALPFKINGVFHLKNNY